MHASKYVIAAIMEIIVFFSWNKFMDINMPIIFRYYKIRVIIKINVIFWIDKSSIWKGIIIFKQTNNEYINKLPLFFENTKEAPTPSPKYP